MDSNLVVRPTCDEDIAHLRRLIVTTWHDTYDQTIGPERVTEITDDWHAADKLLGELGNSDCISVVAEDNGLIAGHGLIKREENGDTWLSRLYVLPERQGTGIGARLLHALEGYLDNCKKLQLEVEESNEQAQAFYAKHGFTRKQRKSSCGDQSGIPTWIMEKQLHFVVTKNKNVHKH